MSKERDRNIRRQKAAQKNKRKRALKSSRPVKDTALNIKKLFSNDEWYFWAAHGCNYMLSDYSEGTWTPLTEKIYDGNGPVPSLNDLVKGMFDKYGQETEGWDVTAKNALAWLAQSREVAYAYKLECEDQISKKDGFEGDPAIEARKPHNSIVWNVFEELKAKLTEVQGS